MADIRCADCPLRKCDLFVPFSDSEIMAQQAFKSGELTADPGTILLMEGSSSPQLFTVLEGMGLRYKTLEDGSRQVLNFVFPGDFIGLQAGVMGEMRHSVEAVTRMRLCVFRRQDIWQLFRETPERAYDLTWVAAVEEHFLGEAVATLGQRSAMERIAWAFLRIFRRLETLGLSTGSSVPLPFRQQDLADALGLSLVHANKTLRRLEERQLATWRGGRLSISDFKELARIGLTEDEPPARRPLM